MGGKILEEEKYTRKELEKKFTYAKVKQLVEEDENYLSIENIVTFRTEKGGREVNEFVEEMRGKIIDGIIKEQKKRKIRNIEGFPRTIVNRRIKDRIEGDRQKRNYKERLEHTQKGWSIVKGKKYKYKTVENGTFVATADIRLKQIISSYLNMLSEDQQKVLTMYYFEENTIGEIAEEMGIKKRAEVYTKKFAALEKLRKVIKENLGPEVEDIRGRLHDISIWQQIINQHPEIIVEPPPPFPINNPQLSEEAKKHMDMLLHSLYDVAKTMSISDMMDEYLFGRLGKEQKELFEKHLAECNECYEDFKERRTILSALIPVLEDKEESEKKRKKKNKYQ